MDKKILICEHIIRKLFVSLHHNNYMVFDKSYD